MNLKDRLNSMLPVLAILFAVVIFIGLFGRNVLADEIPDECGNNELFTDDFLIDGCQFKTVGANPYFILTPGFQRVLVLEEEERSIETVLCETKTINLNDRQIKTRVYEERAQEWDEDEEEWVTVEISLNWLGICKQTNDVYYFGELSRDCEEGFDDDETCEDGTTPVSSGSWEAGLDGAMPGIMMPGTFLLGAKYFQEIAPPDAVDRGENAAMGLTAPDPYGGPDFEGCVMVYDTNPTDEEECGTDDAKIYCPGVGLVQDQDMELVDYGFAGCNNYLPDDDEED
jgi:hypothetical protein